MRLLGRAVTRHAVRIIGVLGVGVFCQVVIAAGVAGSITYEVNPSSLSAPATIQDNGNGIVKVFFQTCLVSGTQATVGFTVTVEPNASGTATWNVLHEEGQPATHSFNPPTMTLVNGVTQTANVLWTFTPGPPNDKFEMFRAKLDPQNGAGLGDGAGIQVRVRCVVSSSPGGTGPGPGGSQPSLLLGSTPLARGLQGVLGAIHSGPATCLAVRAHRLVVGRSGSIRVFVHDSSNNPIANSLVRITGPRGFVRVVRTNVRGVGRFTVPSSRTGRYVIQSDVCLGARIQRAVRSQRAVIRTRPVFTG